MCVSVWCLKEEKCVCDNIPCQSTNVYWDFSFFVHLHLMHTDTDMHTRTHDTSLAQDWEIITFIIYNYLLASPNHNQATQITQLRIPPLLIDIIRLISITQLHPPNVCAHTHTQALIITLKTHASLPLPNPNSPNLSPLCMTGLDFSGLA